MHFADKWERELCFKERLLPSCRLSQTGDLEIAA
jgi:hypothetical protein